MNDNKQTPKTLDDILAEMRNAAKDSYAEKTAKRLEDHEATGTRDALDINDAIQCLRDDDKYLLDLADRIEAVVNRMRDAYCDLCKEKDEAYDRLLLERDKALKANNGNVAAMRESLEYVLQFDASDEAAEEDGLTDAERIAEYADHIEECQKKARAALATPPRNCDRFNSGDPTKDAANAYKEWQRYCDDPLIPPSCKVESAFKQWLFATAKQNGDAK